MTLLAFTLYYRLDGLVKLAQGLAQLRHVGLFLSQDIEGLVEVGLGPAQVLVGREAFGQPQAVGPALSDVGVVSALDGQGGCPRVVGGTGQDLICVQFTGDEEVGVKLQQGGQRVEDG